MELAATTGVAVLSDYQYHALKLIEQEESRWKVEMQLRLLEIR